MIGITIGDACGVGPEILVRTFAEGKLNAASVVYGDFAAVKLAMDRLELEIPVNRISDPAEAETDSLNLIDAGLLSHRDLTIGRISKPCGAAAVANVEAATRAALGGAIRGLVTLPVNKEACRLTRPDFQGHTELITGLCGIVDFTMMLASPKMIVTHVSTHVPLREAIECVKRDRILKVIRLTNHYTRALRGRARIAVAGLNPHAGEHGSFGWEDIEEIRPAVESALAEGMDVHGPFPADTLFMQVVSGRYDAVVCMYHDQGHIPMKLHGFADAVNISLGLPIIRTSVDHGTAFDIAYKGIASTANFEVAMEMCKRLAALQLQELNPA